MTQLDLLAEPLRRPRKRVSVPRTSVLAGQAVNRDGRAFFIVEFLRQVNHEGIEPTSAEIAQDAHYGGDHSMEFDMEDLAPAPLAFLLHVRRGLSDALARGFVEHAPSRKCAVSGKTCVTWRLRSR